MNKSLTNKALQDAAKELGVELAVIRAVDEVESSGEGFLSDGHVKILFERHKFHIFTKGKYDASHPDISNEKPGGYGSTKSQYGRFSKAFDLDKEAAMKSASWGRYQIMGFNYADAGFGSVGSFVDAMKSGEDAQLRAFVNIIRSWGLAPELRGHKWATFARMYNGPAYKRNKYDEKLAAAYAKFKVEPTVTEPATEPEVDPPASPQPDQPGPQINVEHADQVKTDTPAQPIDGGRKDDDPKQASQGGTKSTIATAIGVLTGIGTAIKGVMAGNSGIIIVGIICATVVFLTWMFRQFILDYLRMRYMSDPTKINVK